MLRTACQSLASTERIINHIPKRATPNSLDAAFVPPPEQQKTFSSRRSSAPSLTTMRSFTDANNSDRTFHNRCRDDYRKAQILSGVI